MIVRYFKSRTHLRHISKIFSISFDDGEAAHLQALLTYKRRPSTNPPPGAKPTNHQRKCQVNELRFTFRHENKAQQHTFASNSEFIRIDNINLGDRFRKILPIVGQEDICPCRYSGRKMGRIRSAQTV